MAIRPPRMFKMFHRGVSGWLFAGLLATLWGLGPAIPTIASGQLLGHPWTDLYPSVWGLWWFASEQAYYLPTSLPMFSDSLGAPDGIPFFYSSTIHGVFATPLLSLFSLVDTWNILTVAARISTVLAAYAAGRAWGLRSSGALVAAAVFGCSPFFHGYAVEGIVEGVDGWPLALWLWAVASRRQFLSALFFALTVASSFYMAATAMVLALFIGPTCWLGVVGGLAMSSPIIYGFSSSFSGDSAVGPDVRSSMGTTVGFWKSGFFAEGVQPFAKTSWIGFSAGIIALMSGVKHRKAALLAALFWFLSLGIGPVYALPLFSEIRFPYRFHAGTLVVLAYLVGRWVDDGKFNSRSVRNPLFLVPLIVFEGLLFSPVEAIIPGSTGSVNIVHSLPEGSIVLDIPGPVAMEPNVRNPSRVRARDFLFGQTLTGTNTPWIPDFNSVGVLSVEHADLAVIRGLDPLVSDVLPTELPSLNWVDGVIVHPGELDGRGPEIGELLRRSGWRHSLGEPPGPILYIRP